MRSVGLFIVVVPLDSVRDKRGAIFKTQLDTPAVLLLKLLMEGDVHCHNNDETGCGGLFTD